MVGEAGNDAFAFARGDGNDVVHASASDGADIAAFGEDISTTNSGSPVPAMILSCRSSGRSRLTDTDWYASTNNRLAQVATGNGHTASTAGIEQLVQAMASFALPASGQMTLPPAARLSTALAANWQQP